MKIKLTVIAKSIEDVAEAFMIHEPKSQILIQKAEVIDKKKETIKTCTESPTL